MTPEIESEIKRHTQLFGSYTKSGELKKVRVWLTLNEGKIEFLTSDRTLKAKRVSRNPRVISFLGEHSVPGIAEVVRDKEAIWRTYRAYWKTHPLMMIALAIPIRSKIKSGEQVLIRITPDEPNPFDKITDPAIN